MLKKITTHNVKVVLGGVRSSHDLDPVAGGGLGVAGDLSVLRHVEELEARGVRHAVPRHVHPQPLPVLLASNNNMRCVKAWRQTTTRAVCSEIKEALPNGNVFL
jgi:hypothetical protein